MICVNILKFNTITKRYFTKKYNKKLKKIFNVYKKYIKNIYTKYYYIGFLSYKTTNYIVLF